MDEWDLLKSIIQEDPIPTGTYAGTEPMLASVLLSSSATASSSIISGNSDSSASQEQEVPHTTSDSPTQLALEAAKVAEVVAESHTKACQELESLVDAETEESETSPASSLEGITSYFSDQYDQFVGSATVRKWARVETLVGLGLGLMIGKLDSD
jgi:hypothetical protein